MRFVPPPKLCCGSAVDSLERCQVAKAAHALVDSRWEEGQLLERHVLPWRQVCYLRESNIQAPQLQITQGRQIACSSPVQLQMEQRKSSQPGQVRHIGSAEVEPSEIHLLQRREVGYFKATLKAKVC